MYFPELEIKEYPEEMFEWLISRAKQYLNFLKDKAPNSHKKKWCQSLIAVLKFLGDYRLDEDLSKNGIKGIAPERRDLGSLVCFTSEKMQENEAKTSEEVPAACNDNGKVIERLKGELRLADKEKERCARENPLQFDESKGYARGIATALEIVKSGGVE